MITLSEKRVAVVGMGLSGVAAAQLLHRHKARVAFTDDKRPEELTDALKEVRGLPFEYRLGGIDPALLLDSDLVVLSPGVPSSLPPIERARRAGIDIISEIELAYAFCKAPIVAITGTNGKTTTTMLTHHIVVEAGLKAALAGNVEIPFSQVVGDDSLDIVVLEVSSFQLENIRHFRPTVAVLLNVSSDHLDRYRSIDDYAAAKQRIFLNQTDTDFAVVNRNDRVCMGLVGQAKAGKVEFSMNELVREGAFLRNDAVVARFRGVERELFHVRAIPLFGRHNVENVLASVAATLPMNVAPEIYEHAVATFPGVEHRLERVSEIDGVLFVNDSKATNVVALEKALESFSTPVVLIAGGRGKKSSYRVLRQVVRERVKRMVVIGEDAPLLEDAFGDIVPIEHATTLQEAVKRAAAAACAGDCVLLAPACASFDMFRDYKHRGKAFKEAVQGLQCVTKSSDSSSS